MNGIAFGVVDASENTSRTLKRGEFQRGRLICCAECGYRFFLSNDNLKWYEDHGMEPPKKCHRCRQKAKQRSQKGASKYEM